MYLYYRLKSLIKRKLANFGNWLWLTCHEMSATEMMILRDAERPIKCEHCGLDPIHYFDKTCCKGVTYKGNPKKRSTK